MHDRVDPADIAGAFAPNTRKAYAADWRDWCLWCEAHDAAPLGPDPRLVADYLKASALKVRVVTLRRRLAAIAQAHLVAGVDFDRQSKHIRFAMRRLARELGTAPKAARAELMTEDIAAMVKATRGDGLQEVRDRAIILVGFASGLRRSELVGVDAEHIRWRRDGIVITLPRSKGDQEGAGQEVGVLYARREALCPVRALKRWLEAAAISAGPVFRPVEHGRVLEERASDRAVYRLVKRAAARAGIDPTMLGGHSFRVGHATQAFANGADPVQVKEQLRHRKLDTTLGYNRGRALGSNNTSGKLGL